MHTLASQAAFVLHQNRALTREQAVAMTVSTKTWLNRKIVPLVPFHWLTATASLFIILHVSTDLIVPSSSFPLHPSLISSSLSLGQTHIISLSKGQNHNLLTHGLHVDLSEAAAR